MQKEHTLFAPKLNISKVDMELLADRMQKLAEDDLLQVVQMIHDQKALRRTPKTMLRRVSSTLICTRCPTALSKHYGTLQRPKSTYNENVGKGYRDLGE